MESFTVGDVILNKYELVRVLGKGGMGLVFAARHRDLDALVALKFLLPALRDNAEISARFGREARTGMRIKNEHVARVHDVGAVDGTPFMVMEYLTGQDLAATLRQRGPLPIAESVDLLLQACEALAEAHKLGIVHRDLKPGNLFLTTASDGTPFVKVLDFGISKSTSAESMSVTEGAGVLGSPRYMSPEQLQAASSVDARSDVWSLGAILYEMLSGAPAFAGDSYPELFRAILDGHYAKLSERRPEVPPALEQVLGEALALERDARLSSVEAFAARVAGFGTDAGRASFARIQRIATLPPASAEPSSERPAFELPPPTVDGRDVTPAGQATSAELDIAPSSAAAGSSSRRWRRTAVIGASGAAIVALAVLLQRTGNAPSVAKPVPVIIPSGDPTRLAAAKPPECTPGAPAEYESKCAAKDPSGCYELARILEKGDCLPKDSARAAALYQTACDGDIAAACTNLGVLYARGEGVVRDGAKATALYKRSCDKGDSTACMDLGAMHFEGDGVPKDESLGARFFLRGCDAGQPLGCLNVSIAYAKGQGVPKDAVRAFTFAERACAGGVLRGCVLKARAKIAGDGVAKDVKGGLDELDALCTRGEPTGCESLIKLYFKGNGAELPADPLRVREYAKKACDLGAKESCEIERQLEKTDNADTVLGQAAPLLQAKCDKGNLVACGMLGENLLEGIGANADRAKGIALLEKACRGGVDRACKRLADEQAGDGGPSSHQN